MSSQSEDLYQQALKLSKNYSSSSYDILYDSKECKVYNFKSYISKLILNHGYEVQFKNILENLLAYNKFGDLDLMKNIMYQLFMKNDMDTFFYILQTYEKSFNTLKLFYNNKFICELFKAIIMFLSCCKYSPDQNKMYMNTNYEERFDLMTLIFSHDLYFNLFANLYHPTIELMRKKLNSENFEKSKDLLNDFYSFLKKKHKKIKINDCVLDDDISIMIMDYYI